MYLKSIEIQGFKSFANKLVFEFHNGITGIVGPNGSGKSNVADAVRWVLGEQRIKQLRGASMQDVIFSGTELRKPQGFAYVAITLDNSDHQLAIDYDEVTVSRRLYRSGESEYRINGSACRLKDINELFYDTGIGKEGYSLIGQGQIDKILNGKPEERRELFDEAAGIVKFKRRKALSQKKLEDEEANLVRVKDILAELEKQVGPLERQSKAAKEYLQLKDSLKVCDANLFLMETEGLRLQLSENEKKEAILSGDLEESRKEEERIKADYGRLEEEISALESRISENREELNRENMEKSELEGQINVLKEQIHTEEMNQEHLENRRRAIGEEKNEKAGQLSDYEEDLSSMDEELHRVKARLDSAQFKCNSEEAHIAALEAEIEEFKSSLFQALDEKSDIRAKKQRYDTMLEQANRRRSEVSQQLLKFKSDESVQDEQIAKEEETLAEILKKKEEDELAAGEAEESLSSGEDEIRRLNKSLNDASQDYHTAHTKLESLRNLAERYDGYGISIRKVMETRNHVRGIRGVVADIITTDQKYETAIETALGGSIQNIVTDTEDTAKKLIGYLKQNKFGRATFLPLTSINGGQGFSKPEALKEKGVLGLASQLVHVEKEYEGLASYLLGRVVVADTIDNAIALARKYKYSLRIVTLEGELLSAGGSMTGGAFKNSSNLLGRKREIEELEEKCRSAVALTETLQKELNLKEELFAAKKEELQELKNELQRLALVENTVRMNISQLEEKKAEIRESSSDLVLEYGQLEEQVKDINENREELEEARLGIEEKNTAAEKEIEEKTALLEQSRQVKNTYSSELVEIQMEYAGLGQKQDFITENIKRVRSEMNKLAEEEKGLESGRGASGEAIEEKQKAIRDILGQLEERASHRETLEKTIAKKDAEKEALAQKQKGFFASREEISSRISALDKDMFRLQSQKEKLDERMESAVNYMWTEYELTFSGAEEYRREEYQSMPEVKREIEELKTKIKSLGNINVNAIEDYKEVSERYEFLKNQYEDLVSAKEELEKIIEELDAGMRRQFSEKFADIRSEFDKVFKELFGGGRGTLELMEDEDLLEAGIQIIAQPPGKKLQNMMQLSGGEKALTAISLLFAIQNLKPSPFCLLDEIEAALDDSNVDRFAGYLHKLTKNTQFIVITHRRGTMVSADRLYGITMQEKGVSALVSVNLIENELK